MLRPLRSALPLLAVLIALAAFPWIGEEYYVELAVRLMILALFAISLDLLVGFVGLISFGHAAFFGLGAYILALVSSAAAPESLWTALPACAAGTGLAALVIGALSVRTSGVYFIMITLAFAQMLYSLFSENAALGGSDGILVFHRPLATIGPLTLFDLNDRLTFYYFVLAALALGYLFVAVLVRAPFGRVLRGIRINGARARALGHPIRRYKLASFVIAGTLAGFAGFLEAAHTGYVSPGLLSWHQSGTVLVVVILGGIGTLYGPVLGAFVFGLLQDQLQDLTEHWLLAMGALIIALVLLLPGGLAGLIVRFRQRAAGSRKSATDAYLDRNHRQ